MSRNSIKWSAGLVRALPLEERLSLLGMDMRIGARRTARARKSIECWRKEKPFAKGDAFPRRLRQLSTDEASLARALGLVATREVREHIRRHRLWTTFARLTARRDPAAATPAWEGHRALLHLVLPLLDDAMAALDEAWGRLFEHAEGAAALDLAAMRRCALDDAAAVALAIIEKSCLLDLNIARLRGDLSGRDSRARYRSYVQRLRSGTHARRFFREYPVLLELLATRLEHWRAHVCALVSSWVMDRTPIVTELFDGNDPGRLAGWSGHQGDSHRGGRAVATLLFDSGRKLVYKPRPLDVDVGFSRVVAWCNAKLPQLPLRAARALVRDTYGWCEYIQRDDLPACADAADFYFRQGKFLALFHALHASDMHRDNVIASGADPVYIDLETLFHAISQPLSPQARADTHVRPISLAHTLMLSSDRVVGAARGEQEHWVLALDAAQSRTMRTRITARAGTDEAALVEGIRSVGERGHLPRFEGAEIALDAHIDDVRRGFVAMYDALIEGRDELLALLPRIFKGAVVRQVIRPTALYADFVRNSVHPDHVRDAIERRALFERMFEATAGATWINRLLASEIRDLEALDVPYFSRRFEESCLYDSRGTLVEQLEFRSPRDTVCAHIGRLDAADMRAQLDVMDYSLGHDDAQDQHAAFPSLRSSKPAGLPAFAADRAMQGALAIADGLTERIVRRGNAHYWMCQSAALDGNVTTMSPGVADLYSGQLGIALFLGSAGALYGNGRHVSLALASLRTVEAWTDGGTANLAGVGVYTGMLGYPYVMASLACQLDDRALLLECLAWFDTFEPMRFNDDIDVLGGSAGGVLFLQRLLCAAARHGQCLDRLRELIDIFAERIVAAQVGQAVGVGWLQAQQHEGPPLAGFAHGNAGIAAALYTAAHVLDRAAYREVAREAIRYENHHYVSDSGNWKDLRTATTTNTSADPAGMSTWCHGATGIMLGRAWCLAAAPSRDRLLGELRRDLLRAERTSLRMLQGNDSLCHGSLGNYDVHQAAHALLGDRQLMQRTRATGAAEREPGADAGLRCGDAVETGVHARFAPPDLMCGMAGLGYGLLRRAAPDRVPSVLGLAVLP